MALDRAIRLATKRSLPLDRAWLLAERDRIYEAVMTHGWDGERRTFVQYFGTDALDAANLIMPLAFFISPTDPRMMAELASDSLVYRDEMGRGNAAQAPSLWLSETSDRDSCRAELRAIG